MKILIQSFPHMVFVFSHACIHTQKLICNVNLMFLNFIQHFSGHFLENIQLSSYSFYKHSQSSVKMTVEICYKRRPCKFSQTDTQIPTTSVPPSSKIQVKPIQLCSSTQNSQDLFLPTSPGYLNCDK